MSEALQRRRAALDAERRKIRKRIERAERRIEALRAELVEIDRREAAAIEGAEVWQMHADVAAGLPEAEVMSTVWQDVTTPDRRRRGYRDRVPVDVREGGWVVVAEGKTQAGRRWRDARPMGSVEAPIRFRQDSARSDAGWWTRGSRRGHSRRRLYVIDEEIVSAARIAELCGGGASQRVRDHIAKTQHYARVARMNEERRTARGRDALLFRGAMSSAAG